LCGVNKDELSEGARNEVFARSSTTRIYKAARKGYLAGTQYPQRNDAVTPWMQ
jgi:hypothetical protein